MNTNKRSRSDGHSDYKRRKTSDHREYNKDNRHGHHTSSNRYRGKSDESRHSKDSKYSNVRHHSHHRNNRRRHYNNKKKKRRSVSASKSGGSDSSIDDSVGHLNPRTDGGYLIDDRYVVLNELGVGTFGKVYKCHDRKHKDEVAIKIIRNIKRYLRSAEIESDLLGNVCSAVKKSKQDIADATSSGSTSYDTVADPKFQNRHKFVVKLYSSFYFRGHFCMVQEPLGVSLYDLVKRNKYAGFPLQTVRHIAFQLFSALSYLHDVVGMVHTDLKLENILLTSHCRMDEKVQIPKARDTLNVYGAGGMDGGNSCNYKTCNYHIPSQTTIKVIDFGGATYLHDKKKTNVINTRQYRGPEVILWDGNKSGHGIWNEKTDIWSAGCILCECYTGELLFPTHHDTEHLAMVERLVWDFTQTTGSNISTGSSSSSSSGNVFPESVIEKMSESMIERYLIGGVSATSAAVEYGVRVEKLSSAHRDNVADMLVLSEILIPQSERHVTVTTGSCTAVATGSCSAVPPAADNRRSTEDTFITQNIANYLSSDKLANIVASLAACQCGCRAMYGCHLDTSGSDDSQITSVAASTGIVDVIHHYLPIKFHNLLAACFAIDPQCRISASDAVSALV